MTRKLRETAFGLAIMIIPLLGVVWVVSPVLPPEEGLTVGGSLPEVIQCRRPVMVAHVPAGAAQSRMARSDTRKGLVLDGSEHDGTLAVVWMTMSEGSLSRCAGGAETVRCS